MATTFIVEDGSGYENSNAFLTVEEADQIIENYGNSAVWSAALKTKKEDAIRQATRYMNTAYRWKGYKVYVDQNLQFPRYECYDEDDNYVDHETIPEKVKEACAYLALKVVEGVILLEDVESTERIKRTKDVIGPLTEEIEYVNGDVPGREFQIADRLVSPFVTSNGLLTTDLERG